MTRDQGFSAQAETSNNTVRCYFNDGTQFTEHYGLIQTKRLNGTGPAKSEAINKALTALSEVDNPSSTSNKNNANGDGALME
jgi:hypothetical protein